MPASGWEPPDSIFSPTLVGDEYEKAQLGDLADEYEAMEYGWLFAGNPEAESDALNDDGDGRVLGVIDLYGSVQAVVASNNAGSIPVEELGDADNGVRSVVGPYEVLMRNYDTKLAGREIKVRRTR